MEVSPLLANDTQEHHRRGAANSQAGESTQPLCENPGHAGRRTRHRGGNFRRSSGQCHAAVLARTISEGRRCLHARHGAPHCSRSGSEDQFGCIRVRQPLGPRRRRQSTPGTHQSIGHRDHAADVSRTLRIDRGQALEGSRSEGRAQAAHVVGEHRDKRSKIPPRTYVEALAAPDTVDTMPEKTLLAFAAERQLKRCHANRRRRCRRRARRVLRGRASMSTRSPANCKWMARHRSSSPGLNSCSASRIRAPRWQRLESRTQSARRQARAGSLAGQRPAPDHGLLQRAARPAVAAQRVAFGTSGHRGSSFDIGFNEAHVLASAKPSASTASSKASTDRCSWALTPTRCRRRHSPARWKCWQRTASKQ